MPRRHCPGKEEGMKRLIAVLILFSFCLASPLVALGSTKHAGQPYSMPPQDLPIAPPVGTGQTGDNGQDECGTLGDPDELGGGFRGTTSPPTVSGAGTEASRWIDLVIMLMTQYR
jgi:hypothetical protein